MPEKASGTHAKDLIYSDFLEFSKKLPSKNFFSLIYGSYATSHFRDDSDLDVVFATEEYDSKNYALIKDFVISQHEKYSLQIDEEVPYKNKLLVTYQDIIDAASLSVFKSDTDSFVVPEITNDPEFLASSSARERLLLNALTTPHVFIYGNQDTYSDLRNRCERATIKLAKGLGSLALTAHEAVEILLHEQGSGCDGRAYLGYKSERKEVVDHLRRIVNSHISS